MQPGEGGSLEIHLKEDTHIYTAKEHKPNERTTSQEGCLIYPAAKVEREKTSPFGLSTKNRVREEGVSHKKFETQLLCTRIV